MKLSGFDSPGRCYFTLAAQEGFWDGVEAEVDFWARQVDLPIRHTGEPGGI